MRRSTARSSSRSTGARAAPPATSLARYAITLPATGRRDRGAAQGGPRVLEQDLQRQVHVAQVARLCRAEDERLRAEHGAKMEKLGLVAAAAVRHAAAADGVDQRSWPTNCGAATAKLGVVSADTLGQFAAKPRPVGGAGRPGGRAGGADRHRGTSPCPRRSRSATSSHLLKAMSECAVPSVPELVHPGAGPFRLVERYECLADPRKRLDAVAVEGQSAEAEKRGISATENARRKRADHPAPGGASRGGPARRRAVPDGDHRQGRGRRVHRPRRGRSCAGAGWTRSTRRSSRSSWPSRAAPAARAGTVPDLLADGRLREARRPRWPARRGRRPRRRAAAGQRGPAARSTS